MRGDSITISSENTQMPRVSALVVTYNSADEIRECLDTILNQEADFDIETIVIDNASKDNTADIIDVEFPDITFIRHNENAGFAAANNIAYQDARGEFILLVNPDSKLKPDAVAAAVKHMEKNPKCGLAGGLLVDEEGEAHPSARKFPTPLIKLLTISGLAERFSSSKFFGAGDFRWFDHKTSMEVDWVPGAFTCVRRTMIEELGFFDERFFLYYEETDLCLRAHRNGWETHFIPESVIEHEGGASSKKLEGQVFDAAGGQVRRFRMMAGMLYIKNHGYSSVITNVGVEILWHQLRRIVNFRPGTHARNKRAYSREIINGLRSAMAETSNGSVCPPRPW